MLKAEGVKEADSKTSLTMIVFKGAQKDVVYEY